MIRRNPILDALDKLLAHTAKLKPNAPVSDDFIHEHEQIVQNLQTLVVDFLTESAQMEAAYLAQRERNGVLTANVNQLQSDAHARQSEIERLKDALDQAVLPLPKRQDGV